MSIGFHGRLVASSVVIALQVALTLVHPAGATGRPDAVAVRPVPYPSTRWAWPWTPAPDAS